MHPVKAVPTRYNPFVNGEKTQKPHSSIKPVKTQKTRWVGLFLKKNGFFKPWVNRQHTGHISETQRLVVAISWSRSNESFSRTTTSPSETQ